jgi:hypothetical protein
MATNGNGTGTVWRNWALGVAATIIGTLVVQGLAFQREMRSAIDINEQRIKFLETRARDAIIREFAARDAAIQELKKRIEELEKRR